MKVVILVPRRAGDPHRDRAWEYVRRHWATLGWPICVGHHDEGPFNASAARNDAALMAGDWDVAVFVDGDTIMLDHEPVRRAVELAAESGFFVRPYQTYWMTDERAADRLMATGARPRSGITATRFQSPGGVNVIPRKLWDAVGGYDERFRGWGHEDAAIEIACTSLTGFKQLPGEVFHLWHPISTERVKAKPEYQANVALRRRYERARSPDMMRTLLAERNGGPVAGPEVGAVVITNGRRDCIAATIPSLEAMVGPFVDRMICDDSGDKQYTAWLAETFPAWRIRAHPHFGHGPAVRFALTEAGAFDSDFVWWSEDDVIYERKVDVAAMARVMDAEGPDLKQISLKRQAWFAAEVAAGPSVIDRFDRSLFVERTGPDGAWLEHRQFFTLNPMFIRRELVAVLGHQWPAESNSEHLFGRRLFARPQPRCGIWGARSDQPWVTHFGERTGTGY
jgi:hypothetical protein